MNEARATAESVEQTWLGKLTAVFSSGLKTRRELEEVVDSAHDNKVIDDDAQSIIEGALQVSDMQVRDIMIPRSQMQVVHQDAKLAEILPQITESGHSRYPVVGDSPDNIRGVLLAKDLLPQLLKPAQKDFNIAGLLRPCIVVPESKRLNVLLREFRQSRNHMAIVIDEYGGVAGLVTIEDVLEEIVGNIEDETDPDAAAFIRKLSPTDYDVQALTPIEDFNEAFGSAFSDDEFDTIGGLLMQHFGYLPARNEKATLAGIEFTVLSADQRKMHMLRARVPQPLPEKHGAEKRAEEKRGAEIKAPATQSPRAKPPTAPSSKTKAPETAAQTRRAS